MDAPFLQINSVSKSFGAVQALRSVSFSLRPHEVHALLGENGAGKSTLIKLITGAHQPDAGRIEVFGQAAERLNPATAHALGIAAIYQQPALFPDLSVAENIALGLERPRLARRVRWSDRRERARVLLHRIGAHIDPDAEARSLSMPQQQLVEIARALGAGARIIVMDEPTSSLTQNEVELLFGVIRDLRARGVGIIYISHRLAEIFAVADRVTVLRDGESVATHAIDETNQTSLIKLMIGRDVASLTPRAAAHKPAVSHDRAISLEAAGLCPTNNNAPAHSPLTPALSLRGVGCLASGIHDVTLDIRSGEVIGLAGLVAAGRTELARVLFGITPADTGEIIFNGASVRIRSPRQAIDCGIAYVPEDRRRHGIVLEMSIASNVTMPIHSTFFPWSWLRSTAERKLAEQYMCDLAVKAPSADTCGSALSGGNQQKIALARWLATNPKLLILDEPTQGVDVGAKVEIHRLIRRLAQAGLAVLMISSDLPEVLGMSDRIAVMRGGTITAQFDGAGATAHEVMAAALGQTVSEGARA